MNTKRGHWFLNFKKLFLVVVLFFGFFSISSIDLHAQTPNLSSVDFTKNLSDADKEKIVSEKTYFYVEKYADGSAYYLEALYFDKNGQYLGHLASGDKDGNKKDKYYRFQRTTATSGGYIYTNRESDGSIIEIKTQIKNGVEFVIEESMRIDPIDGGIMSPDIPGIDATVKYGIGNNGELTGMTVSAKTTDVRDNGRCVLNEWGAIKNSEYYAGSSLWNCIEQVLYSVLGIMAWVLGLSVWLFTAVFDITVLGMTKFINSMEAINIVWKVFRDFSNILFIFILLYLAISTIIGLNEHGVKHTLSKLILVAILINFSMFFAKVVIDSSNILAISFYKKINPSDSSFAGGIGEPFSGSTDKIDIKAYIKNDGIAGAFMGSFKLQKVFEDKNGDVETDATAFATRPDAGTVFIMGTIAMFIVFCIFIAATIIFIKRLTTLTILVMTSSLAFASSLLHKTEHMAHEWWEKLLKEAFYAPVFVAVIWMAILVMTDPNFGGTFLDKKAEGFFNVSTIINYVIVINFFIMALVAGEKMGASGASGAMKLFKGMKSQIGGRMVQAGIRNTLGRAAYRLYEGKDKGGHGPKGAFKVWMEKSISKGGVMGSIAGTMKSGLKSAVNAKVGPGASFAEDFAEKQHAIAETLFELKGDPAAQADYLREMSIKAQKNLSVQVALEKNFESMKSDEQAELLAQLDKKVTESTGNMSAQFKTTRDKLYGRLSDVQKESVDKKLEGPLRIHKEEFRALNDKALATTEGQEMTKKQKELEEKEKAIETMAVSDPAYAQTKAAISRLTTEIEGHKTNLVSTQEGQALRRYFKSLNTKQQTNLSNDQVKSPLVRDLLSGNSFEQLQRDSRLNQSDYQILGSEMDKQAKRLSQYAEAINSNDTATEAAFVDKINTHLKSLGQGTLTTFEDAREFYEKRLMGADTTTTRALKGMGRFFEAELSEEGENIIKEAQKAKKVDAQQRSVNKQTQQQAQVAAQTQQRAQQGAQVRQRAQQRAQQQAQSGFNSWTP